MSVPLSMELKSPTAMRAKAQPSFFCMDTESMGSASSDLTTAYYRCSKSVRECSPKSSVAHPQPKPPPEGRAGILPVLPSAGARTILPDMRGFGASGKPREMTVYADSAMAKDVIALIAYLHLDSVDIIGFSMGAGTAARLLMLGPPQVKSAILAGIGDYAIEDTILEFPKDWPIPDYIPRPLTMKVWTEEGARILDQGEIVLVTWGPRTLSRLG